MLVCSGVERAKAGIVMLKNLVKDIQDIRYVSERYLRLDLRIYIEIIL